MNVIIKFLLLIWKLDLMSLSSERSRYNASAATPSHNVHLWKLHTASENSANNETSQSGPGPRRRMESIENGQAIIMRLTILTCATSSSTIKFLFIEILHTIASANRIVLVSCWAVLNAVEVTGRRIGCGLRESRESSRGLGWRTCCSGLWWWWCGRYLSWNGTCSTRSKVVVITWEEKVGILSFRKSRPFN